MKDWKSLLGKVSTVEQLEEFLNQVCGGGVILGAICVDEERKKLIEKLTEGGKADIRGYDFETGDRIHVTSLADVSPSDYASVDLHSLSYEVKT